MFIILEANLLKTKVSYVTLAEKYYIQSNFKLTIHGCVVLTLINQISKLIATFDKNLMKLQI